MDDGKSFTDRHTDIKDLLTVLEISGSRNCAILVISVSRFNMVQFLYPKPASICLFAGSFLNRSVFLFNLALEHI